MAHRRDVTLALIALLAAAPPAAAQRALGIGGDASTLPTGTARISAGLVWDRANERYDGDGTLRPLGANASAASWNGRYDARLDAASPLVASLSGLAAFEPTLGALAIGRRDAAQDAAIGVEVGVLRRLTVGARMIAASHTIEPRVVLNPRRVEGTMGFNPAWANTVARDRNVALVAQFDSAVAQTSRRITQCQATPTATDCAPIAANVAGAQALVASAATFATSLNQLYGGRKNATGLPFVPLANSAAQQAINQRILGFRDQFVAFGNTALGTQGPTAAALFSLADISTLLTDSLYGYRLRPARTVHAYGLGEVTVHAKARVFDSVGDDTASVRGFAVRQAIGGTLRVTGSSTPDPNEAFAPVTGDRGRGVALQSFTDLFYGDRWSASFVVGLDAAQSESYVLRVPGAESPSVGGVAFPFVPASRATRITRRPASRVDIAVTPRVQLTRNIRLGGSWRMASQAADQWTARLGGGGGTGSGDVATDVATWASGTNWSEQRVTLGGTYSTVEAVRRGQARIAFDVTYEHEQTISGNGWRVAHLSRDYVTVRWYRSFWGRR